MIECEALPRIAGRESCKFEGNDGTFSEALFLKLFALFSDRKGFLRQKGEMGVLVCFSDILEKLPFKTRANWAFFQFYPIFPLVPP